MTGPRESVHFVFSTSLPRGHWGLKENETLFSYLSLLGPVIRCLFVLAMKALSYRVSNKFKGFFVNKLFISFKTNLHFLVLLPCRFQQSEHPTMKYTENMENVDFELLNAALI